MLLQMVFFVLKMHKKLYWLEVDSEMWEYTEFSIPIIV